MPYKTFPDAISCTNAAEALGRLYCASKSKPWPEAPDSYTAGLQPQPPAAFYQRYWTPPCPAVAPNATAGILTPLPIRIEVDAFTQSQSGKVVTITGNVQVTLDFTALVADPIAMQATQVGA